MACKIIHVASTPTFAFVLLSSSHESAFSPLYFWEKNDTLDSNSSSFSVFLLYTDSHVKYIKTVCSDAYKEFEKEIQEDLQEVDDRLEEEEVRPLYIICTVHLARIDSALLISANFACAL